MALWHELKDHHRIDAYRRGNAEIDWHSEQAQGLVLAMPLGKFSGLEDFDLTPTKIHGTRTNGPTRVVSHRDNFGTTNVLSFDGINERITLNSDEVLNPFSNGQGTFCIWAKRNSVAGADRPLFGTSGGSGGWQLDVEDTDRSSKFRFTFMGVVDYKFDYAFTDTTKWHSISVCVDADNDAFLYFDGTLRDSISGAANANTATGNYTIGHNNNNYWEDLLDDPRIYNIQLSADLTKDIYLHPYRLYKPRKRVFYSFASAGDPVLSADSGSYVVAGTSAILKAARKLTALAASFIIAGSSVGLTHTSRLDAESGAFVVAGSNAGLVRSGRLSSNTGAFTVSGSDATLTHGTSSPTITADSGSFVISGSDATLTYSGDDMIQDTIESADAVVAILNAAGLTEGIVFARKFIPEFDPKDLDVPKGIVVPASIGIETASRITDQEDHSVEIGIGRLIDNEDADIVLQLATVDEVLVELRKEENKVITTTVDLDEVNFVGLDATLFVPEKLRQHVALSVIRVTYRGFT